ncbi:MAG: hypothetical protein JWM74_659 [Myxococcaceae bacterium]|nr:hypothetical protein [Myxococcaceae bacterium]
MAQRRLPKFLITLLVLAAAGAILVFVVAPWYAKKLAIETAAHEGVRLTVERASVGLDGVHLSTLTASVPETPGSLATIDDMTIAFSGVTPKTATLRGVELTLEGDAQQLMLGLASARRVGEPTGAGGPLEKVIVQNAHVRWNGALGPSTSVDATDVAAELLPAPRLGDELHATAGNVRVAMGRELGPWRVAYDRSPTLLRTVIDFDPTERGAATIAFARTMAPGKPDATTIEGEIRKRKLSKLGIPGAVLLLPSKDDPEIEAHVKHASPSPARSEGAVSFVVRGLQLPQMTVPGDVALDVAWAGDPASAIALSRGTFTLGPFTGDVHGTVQPYDGGFRTDLAFKSKPVSCEVLAGTQLGGASAPLAALAQVTGLARAVTGDADISGVLVFDSSKTAATRFELTPASRCGLALFPANGQQAR